MDHKLFIRQLLLGYWSRCKKSSCYRCCLQRLQQRTGPNQDFGQRLHRHHRFYSIQTMVRISLRQGSWPQEERQIDWRRRSSLQRWVTDSLILDQDLETFSIHKNPFRTKICCRPKETWCPQKGSRSCRCLGWTILPRSSPCPYCFPTRSNWPMRRIHPWRQRTRLLRQKTQGQEIQINVKIRINEFLSQCCFILPRRMRCSRGLEVMFSKAGQYNLEVMVVFLCV